MIDSLLYPGRVLFDMDRLQFVKLIRFDHQSFESCHVNCHRLLWYVVPMEEPYETYSVETRFLTHTSPLELLARCAE